MRHLRVTVSIFGLIGLSACGGGGGGGGAASPSTIPSPPSTPPVEAPAPVPAPTTPEPTPTTPAPTPPAETPAQPQMPAPTPPAEPDAEPSVPGGSGEEEMPSAQDPVTVPETPPVAEEPATPPPETPIETPVEPPVAFEPRPWDTEEFQANPSAAQLKAGAAYELGLTGAGTRIAILGAPVDPNNPELAGRLVDAGEDFGTILRDDGAGGTTLLARPADSFVYDQRQESDMAAVAAGARDYYDFMGVAPEAQIVSFRIDQIREAADGTRTGQSSSSGWSSNARAIEAGLDQGIRLFAQAGGLASHSPATDAAWYRSQPGFSQFQAANDRAGRDGALMIYAAGDDGASTAANWLLVNDDNRRNIMLVGAVDADNVILAGSARAGLAKDNYLVAPGSWYTTGAGGSRQALTGTAYAAASVAGAAALIMERWPQLRGEEVADILFSTATDLGDSGVDPVYGHGLVDLEAAMQPQGAQLGSGLRESAIAVTGAVLPEGFGTSGLAGALSSVTVLDAFGRDYQASLGGLVASVPSIPSLASRVEALTTDRMAGFATSRLSVSFSYHVRQFAGREGVDGPQTSLGSAYLAGAAGRFDWQLGLRTSLATGQGALGLAPVEDGLAAYAPGADRNIGFGMGVGRGRIGLVAASGAHGNGRTTAVAVEYGRGGTTLRAGLVHEQGTVMGAESTGALKLGSSVRTFMVEAKQSLSLGAGWTLGAYGSIGLSRIKADSRSLFDDWGDVIGTRFGLSVNGDLGRHGRIDFGLAQPLTIERADARLLLPTGYDRATRSLRMVNQRVDLSADERPLLLSAGYARSWERGPTLRVGAVQSLSGDMTGAIASLGWSF